MRILFLDDDVEGRTMEFLRHCPKATCVETAQEMIDLLKDGPADYVFLDHDLGGEIFVDTKGKNTGSEVVRWIKINKPAVGMFIVHTLNPGPGSAMEKDLRGMGYAVQRAPWGSFNWQAVESLNQ